MITNRIISGVSLRLLGTISNAHCRIIVTSMLLKSQNGRTYVHHTLARKKDDTWMIEGACAIDV